MAYITKSDLENYMQITIAAGLSSFVTSVIAMVTAYINGYTNTNFENSTATTRYFDGWCSDVLHIGDFQAGTLTSVQILDTTGTAIETLTLNTDYVEYPYNEATPNAIKLLPGGMRLQFPNYKRAVKVTGKFGYSTVPDDVKSVALMLAKQIMDTGYKGGPVKAESLGQYNITYADVDEKAKAMAIFNILDRYRQIAMV